MIAANLPHFFIVIIIMLCIAEFYVDAFPKVLKRDVKYLMYTSLPNNTFSPIYTCCVPSTTRR